MKSFSQSCQGAKSRKEQIFVCFAYFAPWRETSLLFQFLHAFSGGGYLIFPFPVGAGLAYAVTDCPEGQEGQASVALGRNMKKLINEPENVVREALEGMQAAHGDRIRVNLEPFYVVRSDAPQAGKVGLVSGGGSGHEPMHCGYVGRGMLDAACPGQIFTSPTPDQIFEASKAVNGGAGVLHIVKNYTGDVMNFELAAEMLSDDGMAVESVLVDDDVAVENSLYTAGRRGVGLTVLMEKLLGAAAEERISLAEIKKLGDLIRSSGRSMGMALTSCTVPHAGKPSFELPEDEIELGIGIHGEPGRHRVKMATADEITEQLMEPILTDLPFKRGDAVLMFVNGMGGTPLIELYIVYRKAAAIAKAHGLKVVRNLVGSYITSLEMAGTSITLLHMNDCLCELWDAPVNTPALRWGI